MNAVAGINQKQNFDASTQCNKLQSKRRPVYTIDVKDIDLQIKDIKNMFFHFHKNIKNMHKNIKLQYSFK